MGGQGPGGDATWSCPRAEEDRWECVCARARAPRTGARSGQVGVWGREGEGHGDAARVKPEAPTTLTF